jgi:PKD repeat protein
MLIMFHFPIYFRTLTIGLFWCIALVSLQAQTTISGIINRYASVTAIDTCGRLTVSDTAGFRIGTPVLLLQMQGATASISTANNGNTYGNVAAFGCAGCYEKAEVGFVQANTIWLKEKLINNYTTTGLQLVTMPRYTDVTVTDTLKPRAWNGRIGGVLALEVTGTLTVNGPILADGLGFRGGAASSLTNTGCFAFISTTGFFFAFNANEWRGARKGEGISAITAGHELGKGAWSNAGGGGNDHNSGGGGGGNLNGGGRGGDNDEPRSANCDGQNPGVGAKPLTAAPANRLFAGGGGGAGHENTPPAESAGGNGGGIIMIQAGRIAGSNVRITSNGLNAYQGYGDGAGGGGGGGSVWLQAGTAPTNMIVQANGGRGGVTQADGPPRCFGPGGGGGGGRILTNLTGISAPTGGEPGIVESAGGAACLGRSNGAAAGPAGRVDPLTALTRGTQPNILPIWTAQPRAQTVCEGKPARFSANLPGSGVAYQWEINTGTGWTPASGTAFSGSNTTNLTLNSPASTLNGAQLRLRARYGICFNEVSDTTSIRVRPGAKPTFDVSQQGLGVTFTNTSQNATTYQWTFGDGNTSNEANPKYLYPREGDFTVVLKAISACDTVEVRRNITIILPPKAIFTARDTVPGCDAAVFSPVNQTSGSNATYEWTFSGGTPSTSTAAAPNVRFTASGNYTARLIASNAGGRDTALKTFTVRIFQLPTAAFTFTALGNGSVQFNNQSQNALSYVWLFGDGTQPVTGANPVHRFARNGSFVVTLVVNNPCGAAVLQQRVTVAGFQAPGLQWVDTKAVRVFPNPSVSHFAIDAETAEAPPVQFRLFDWSGRLVLDRQTDVGFYTELEWPAVQSGVYHIEIIFDTGQRIVKQLVKL